MAFGTIILTLVIAILFRRFDISINLTLLAVAAILIPTWYGGFGPGLLVVLTFVFFTAFSRPPAPDASIAAFVFGHVSTFVLLLLLVVLVASRRQTEARVRESESRFSGIIESAMDAIITIDSKQKIVVFNAAAETMFKCRATDAIGQRIERFVPERFRDGHADNVRKFGQTNTTTRSLSSLGGIFGLRADGEEFPIEASISQLNADGEKFFTIILRDITERARAEKRFQLAVESAPNSMIMADGDGKIILVNSQTETLFGYDRSELYGQPVEILVPERFRRRHPEYRAEFAADPHVRAMGAGRDLYGLRRDGTEVPVEIGLNPIEMEGGIFTLSSIVDITDRKRAEAKLRQSEELFAMAFDHAPIGVALVTRDGRWAKVNRALCEIVGYSEEELLKLTTSDITHPDDVEESADKLRQIFEGEVSSYVTEKRYIHSQGQIVTVQLDVGLIRDQNGEPLYVIGQNQDITKRKQTEENLARLNVELEQRVRDRTQELESANRELEAFSFSVSHDLRAPLRHIDGFTKLLVKREADNLDSKSAHYLEVISGSVGKMGVLIDELLTFSRTTRKELHPTEIDLNLLTKESLTVLEPAIAARTIKWRIDSLPRVKGDRGLLQLVMTNLLSNAIKYSRHREEAIIEIGFAEKERGTATIFVRDNGAGFDMKYADRLFGVFQRLHREDEFEGVGIGLATVQRIIRRHGGQVWADAKPDCGATFYFTLEAVDRR